MLCVTVSIWSLFGVRTIHVNQCMLITVTYHITLNCPSFSQQLQNKHIVWFFLEPTKKGFQSTECNMGNKNQASSVENLLDLDGEDKPRGRSPSADPKEKPGRHHPLKRGPVRISIATLSLTMES